MVPLPAPEKPEITVSIPLLVMDSGHIVLSALQPETIENRVTDNPSAGGKEDD